MDENGNWQEALDQEEEMMQVDEIPLDPKDEHHDHHQQQQEPEVSLGYKDDLKMLQQDLVVARDSDYSDGPNMLSTPSPLNKYLFLTHHHHHQQKESHTPQTRAADLPKDQKLMTDKVDHQDRTCSLNVPLFLSRACPDSVARVHAQTREVKGILRKGGRRSIRFAGEDQTKAFYSKYEPREVLGEGLSSTVRLAVDKTTNEEVAVKIIDVSEAGRDPNSSADGIREDTLREIEMLELCKKHKQINVVELIAHYETPTYIFLVFELCKQGDLFDYLNQDFQVSEKRTRSFMRQLLQVVDFLHSNRIVHRDLKLENILVMTKPASDESKEPQPMIKVADFGFATVVPQGENLQQCLGTLAVMAPEILDVFTGKGYSFPIDLWACGVIMFTLIEKNAPFSHRNQQKLKRKIRKADFGFFHMAWTDVCVEAKDLITKLLVVDPECRYTARQALEHPFFQMDD